MALSNVSSYRSKKTPSRHGNVKLNPGPRKKQPMITSTAQNMRNRVMMAMASLRSSGWLLGFLSV